MNHSETSLQVNVIPLEEEPVGYVVLPKDEEIRAQLSQKLRALWKERSAGDPTLTQDRVGKQLGISKSAVSYILSGRSTLGITHAYKLAVLLGTDVRNLIDIKLASENTQRVVANVNRSDGQVYAADVQRAFVIATKMLPSANEEQRLKLSLDATLSMTTNSSSDEEIEDALKRAIVNNLSISSKPTVGT